MERTAKDHIMLDTGEGWATFNLGDEVPLRDGIFLGKTGSAVVFGGCLVAAWEERNYVVPHGSPRNWVEIESKLNRLDDMVAHIPMSALQAAAKREHLDWEKDCLPRLAKLLELVSLQVEPIHMCMIACNKLRSEIKEGRA